MEGRDRRILARDLEKGGALLRNRDRKIHSLLGRKRNRRNSKGGGKMAISLGRSNALGGEKPPFGVRISKDQKANLPCTPCGRGGG